MRPMRLLPAILAAALTPVACSTTPSSAGPRTLTIEIAHTGAVRAAAPSSADLSARVHGAGCAVWSVDPYSQGVSDLVVQIRVPDGPTAALVAMVRRLPDVRRVDVDPPSAYGRRPLHAVNPTRGALRRPCSSHGI